MDSLFQLLGGSSPYDPAITADAAGSSLMGTLAQPEPQRPPQLQAMDQVQQGYMEANEPPDVPVGKATVDGRTGRWSFSDVSPRFLSEVMGSMNDLKTMQQAAMARVAQLKQQESSGSPLLDALSQLAGGMAANDPTMPGWVRALGATSLQMGPQGIKRERMMEEARLSEITKTQIAAASEMNQMQLAERQLKLAEGRAVSAEEERRLARIEAAAKAVADRYKDEVDKGRPVDPMLLAAELAGAGLPPDRAIASASLMAKQAETNAAEIEKTRAMEIRTKQELEEYKAGLDLRNDLTLQARREALKFADLNFRRETELLKIETANKEKKAQEKKLPAAQRKTLVEINALDEKLDNLFNRVKQYEWTTGPLGGRVGTALEYVRPDSEFAAERRAIRSELSRFVAQYVKAVQGGGNTISNKDVENAAKALPNMNLSIPQFEALVRSIKEEGEYQRRAIRAAYEADWEGNDKVLLGAPKPKKGKGTGLQVPEGWTVEEVP